MPGKKDIVQDATIEDIRRAMYEDFELLDLKESIAAAMRVKEERKPKGYQRVGSWARLDRKQTAQQRIKRQIASQKSGKKEFPFTENDLRYKRMKEESKNANAVIFCIRDISTSMEQDRRYLVCAFFAFLVDLLREKYPRLEIRFIVHHTEASEAVGGNDKENERLFMRAESSGGTFCSSGFEKVLEIIEKEYDPDMWNIYAFYCSDGENVSTNNEQTVNAVRKLSEISRFIGFGQTNNKPITSYSQLLLDVFKEELGDCDVLHSAKITEKEDVRSALLEFIRQENLRGRRLR